MVYFLIGANLLGKNGNAKTTWDIIQKEIGSQCNSVMLDAEMSRYRLGNLDSLFHNTEVMQKLENQFEGLLRKIERQYLEITGEQEAKFTIETSDSNQDIPKYLFKFKWQDSKFPRTQALTEILNNLKKKAEKIDEQFRKKTHDYQEEKNKLQALTTKEGNLYVKDLHDVFRPELVKNSDFHYTDHVTTVVVIVPKSKTQEFLDSYQNLESCSSNVLPGSAKQFTQIEDRDNLAVFRVLIFKKEIDPKILNQIEKEKQDLEEDKAKIEDGQQVNRKKFIYKTPVERFTVECREKLGVSVREFKYSKGFYDNREQQRLKVKTTSDAEKNQLLVLCKNNFSELYLIYIHLKHLRLVVDNAARFGQREPVVTAIINPNHGKDKQVVQTLTKMFCEPNQMGMYGTKEELEDTEDFYPFVYIPINHF